VSEFERVKIALRRVSWKSKTRRNGRIASLMNSNFRASITGRLTALRNGEHGRRQVYAGEIDFRRRK